MLWMAFVSITVVAVVAVWKLVDGLMAQAQ
jgi:hypothetical protein